MSIPDPTVDQLSMDLTALTEIIHELFTIARTKAMDSAVFSAHEILVAASVSEYIASPQSREALKRLLTPLRKSPSV